MKSGVIGVVNGEFDKIPSFERSVETDHGEVKQCVEIRDEFRLSDGHLAQFGRVARQTFEEEESVQIQDGTIGTFRDRSRATEYTEFLTISGEFVIVASGNGSFAYDLIGERTDTNIERGNIDLQAFFSEHTDGDYWQVGFYNSATEAENGVIYGDNVFDDPDVGATLELSDINQLGVTYAYQDQKIKTTLTESGYINIYDPGSYESDDFLSYFQEEIASFVSVL
ncbi:hypothetical protein [Natrinema pallidum]|uniref:hypothetical protein n=1 Tax=Natrinema pallidum TaxID=69527 RepID=UPI0012692B28|nr:hypothetical protein [Natrinema pallidum]